MILINSITDEWKDFVDEIKEETGQCVVLEELDYSPDNYLCIVPSHEQPIITDGIIRSRLYAKSNIECRVIAVANIVTIYSPTYVIYHPILLGSDDNILWHICVKELYLELESLSKQYKETIIDRLKFAIKESEEYDIADEEEKVPRDVYGQITLNPYKHIMN